MAITLNHTIVWCRDKQASASYLADILGLSEPSPWGPFLIVEMANSLSLDFHDDHQPDGTIASQHYAFLVSEDEFDQIFGRIRACRQEYWADPGLDQAGEINRRDGGRGVYFRDPDGHLLEILTRPYGSGG
jgi:catechol 2,3-dioxygenase-like lactoylglutathione lyase family enzyme